jgi:lycopene beta-cyclase
MSDQPFPARSGKHIINIGTAGGQTKASTGYTFYFVQKHTAAIVAALQAGRSPLIGRSILKRRFLLYDSTLLQILKYQKYPGHKIFSSMFAKNPAPRVLRFLSEESTVMDEISMFAKLPLWIFLRSFLSTTWKRAMAALRS